MMHRAFVAGLAIFRDPTRYSYTIYPYSTRVYYSEHLDDANVGVGVSGRYSHWSTITAFVKKLALVLEYFDLQIPVS